MTWQLVVLVLGLWWGLVVVLVVAMRHPSKMTRSTGQSSSNGHGAD